MNKQMTKKESGSGSGLVIGIAVIYILFGLAMIMMPQFKESYIIYMAGVVLVIYGIILIVRYFMSGSYQDIRKYGFSGGVLSILCGLCTLVRTQEIASYFSLFLGICILLTSVVKLQNAVDLKTIENSVWIVFLVIAIVFIVASLAIILDPLNKVSDNEQFIYYVLVADGVVNIIEMLFLAIAIRTSRKKEEKELKKQNKQEEAISPKKLEESDEPKQITERMEQNGKHPESGDFCEVSETKKSNDSRGETSKTSESEGTKKETSASETLKQKTSESEEVTQQISKAEDAKQESANMEEVKAKENTFFGHFKKK